MGLLSGVIVDQGNCVVERVSVSRESPDVVIVDIDCETKRPEIAMYSGRQLFLDGSDGNELTRVEFRGEGDVMLFAEVVRYTVHVAIVRSYTEHVRSWDV